MQTVISNLEKVKVIDFLISKTFILYHSFPAHLKRKMISCKRRRENKFAESLYEIRIRKDKIIFKPFEIFKMINA